VIHRVMADLLVVLHLAFIGFVCLGGLLALRWPRLAWAHLPCALWGVLIEFTGWICPLTPLENRWRVQGGLAGYDDGFIAHYLLPLVYPPGLTPTVQWVLGGIVVLANVVVYTLVVRRRRRRRQQRRANIDGNAH
jgi:hypothetical protein